MVTSVKMKKQDLKLFDKMKNYSTIKKGMKILQVLFCSR